MMYNDVQHILYLRVRNILVVQFLFAQPKPLWEWIR